MTLDIPIPPKPTPDPATLIPRPPLVDEQGRMLIDNSSLEHFTTCARSAEYYLVERREPSYHRSALSFGGLIHKALEVFYLNGGAEGDFNSFLKAIYEMADKHFDTHPTEDGDFRTKEKFLDTMISYWTAAETDHFKILSINEEPFVEKYFQLPLGSVEFNGEYNGKPLKNIDVFWTGRIDMIVEMDGKFWILDHKTTSIMGETFFADFVNSSQAKGYVWAAQQLLQKPVEGFYLNAIATRKPSKTGIPFQRETKRYPYDPEHISEWEFNTLTLVSDFLSHLTREYFPMETKWCVGKYGKCKYFDVCSLPPSQREVTLYSNLYTDVTWNPQN
jgi:hypothetical protein